MKPELLGEYRLGFKALILRHEMNSSGRKEWASGPSPIHGQGAFAKEPIGDGEFVDYLILGAKTPLGDYLNHQAKPNGKMVQVPSKPMHYYLRSSNEISPGEELTMDYNDSPDFVAKPHQIDPENYKNWK